MLARKGNGPDLQPWPRPANRLIKDVMSWPAVVVAPALSANIAIQQALQNGCHHLPVVLHADVLGVACTCDLAEAAPHEAVATRLRRRPVSISPTATLAEAAERMDDSGINSLVTLWRSCRGIVTRGDLVRAGVSRRRTCQSCAGGHHVRRHPRDQAFGRRFYDDLGGGD
jgi:signal-transduction protein with cAMP-binding, CBS, and nucleotidyltransferase domain